MARERGRGEPTLDMWEGNDTARAFFEVRGFVRFRVWMRMGT